MNDWKWVGNRRNLSDFSNWVGRVEGSPCHPHCVNIYGLLLSAPQYKWKAENKGLAYPYICVSDCAIGYIWLREAKKCVKIGKNEKGSLGEASVQCAKDNSRLLSIKSCEQFLGLQSDLWTKYPQKEEKYWFGFYAEGFSLYTDQSRVGETLVNTINASGRKGVGPNGDLANCQSNKLLVPITNTLYSK